MASQRILLVDDAAETRTFLAESVLAPEGYEVITADNGATALQLALESLPDMIIADYLMPEMTGLELLEALKQQGLNVPFVLITAEGSEALAVRAMRLGVRDYLIKPFAIDDFLETIRRITAEDAKEHIRRTSQVMPDFATAQADKLLGQLLWEASDILLITDPKNRLYYFNKAAQMIFNLKGDEALGSAVDEMIDHPTLLAIFEEEGIKNKRYEVEFLGDRWFNAHLSNLAGVGKVLIMQDISQLKALDRAKSDFVTTISHDLRSPLTTILGYVELLGRVGPLNDQQTKFIENILFSVRSITAMLTDLLELSRIEAGYDSSREPVQMDIIARYAIETHRRLLEEKKQQLEIDIPTALAPVEGNPIRLKQLVSNLLENAIKYTPPNGAIAVRLFEDNGFIVLQVSDTGIGIPTEDQPYIWDKFYRSAEAVEGFPGTGLGLSIVKSIVDAHGGRIWTDSVPNEGSTFTVMLPAKQP